MKKLVLFFSIAIAALAQQRETVFLPLAAGLTTAPAGPYLVTNNVGQTFHTFTAYLIGSGSCANVAVMSQFQAVVEVSYDGVHYNGIGSANYVSQDTTNNTTLNSTRMAGAYPFVRLRVINFPTGTIPASCSISIAYSGSLQANPLSDLKIQNTVSAFSYTSACTVIYQGPLNQSFYLVGLEIIPSVSGQTVNFFKDNGTCTESITSFTLLGNLLIPPDPLNSPIEFFSSNPFITPPFNFNLSASSSAAYGLVMWYRTVP